MGIFDFIFGKTQKIDDNFFGKMIFLDDKKNPLKSYFECSRHFKPINKVIDIGIEGDIIGPTKLQKDFFREIEENYDKITSTIKPIIEDEFRNWKEDFEIIDFKKEFKAVYLFLPRCEKEPKIWEIAFESSHDLDHTFTVTMKDLKATEVLIDG